MYFGIKPVWAETEMIADEDSKWVQHDFPRFPRGKCNKSARARALTVGDNGYLLWKKNVDTFCLPLL